MKGLRDNPQLVSIMRLFYLTVPLENATLHEEFLERITQYEVSLPEARRMMQKIIDARHYPLYNYNFLVWLLTQLDTVTFKKLIVSNLRRWFNSDYDMQRIYRKLAETNAHNFAFIYIKYKRRLTKGLGSYDSTAKEIYKICWKKLNILERLLTIWPF